MYFKITDEIVDAAINKNKKALELLTMLEWCHKYGKHLVYGDVSALIKINTKFSTQLPVLSKLYTNIATTGAQVDSLEWHLEFVIGSSVDSHKEIDKRIIFVNIDDISNFEVYKECHLLAEHLNDIIVFRYILNYYKRLNGFTLNNNFYPLLGGGSTIADVYQSEVKQKKALLICITDSDKHSPSDSIGGTAKNIIKVDNRNNFFHTYCYVMENFLEVENLLPLNVYRTYVNKNKERKQLQPILDNLTKLCEANEQYYCYFDLKKGITPSRFTKKATSSFQYDMARVISADVDEKIAEFESKWISFKEKLLNPPLSMSPNEAENVFAKCKKDDFVIPGFGSKILDNVLADCSEVLENIKKEDLNETQQKEYMRIGNLLYNWTCSSNVILI